MAFAQSPAAPQPPSLIDDVRFTPSQIQTATAYGIDTATWAIDPELVQDLPNKASATWAPNWPSPDANAEHLRIPYRIKTEDFSEAEYNVIKDSLNQLSGYLNGCIEFFDDTFKQSYESKYILVRNTNEAGVYEGGCWSLVGFSNPVTYQNLNLGAGCVSNAVVQHEFLHALGFLHEQSRPDRDDHIEILWDNILPEMHSQFWKMPDHEWDPNLKEHYDVKSVLHYEGWAFLTPEAAEAGNSTIVYKGTNDRFLNAPPAASASDIQQVLRRNPDYCQARTDLIYCDGPSGNWTEGDQYYFDFQACDGFENCNNGNDEAFEVCGDLGCGKKMQVSGLRGDIDGIYEFYNVAHNNNRPVYQRNDGMFMYSWTGNGNWHFNHELDSGSTGAWAPGDRCPTFKDWFVWDNENWTIVPNGLVEEYFDGSGEESGGESGDGSGDDDDNEDDLTDEKLCANNTVPVVSGKRGKILREGDNSFILRVNHPMSEESDASLVVVFSRFFCGADFLSQLNNGDIM